MILVLHKKTRQPDPNGFHIHPLFLDIEIWSPSFENNKRLDHAPNFLQNPVYILLGRKNKSEPTSCQKSNEWLI
jgi:hypothetical protein